MQFFLAHLFSDRLSGDSVATEPTTPTVTTVDTFDDDAARQGDRVLVASR